MSITVTVPAGCLSCCGGGCSGPTSGENVFSITKEEYDAYKAGGTWSIDWSLTIAESWTGPDYENGGTTTYTTSGSGSGTVTGSGSGCTHTINQDPTEFSYSYTDEYGYTYTNNDGPVAFSLQLGQSGSNYYAKFSGSVWNMSSEEPDGGDTTYPPTRTLTADGNSLTTYGLWDPGALNNDAYTGYSNTSSVSFSATFTPSA